MGLHRLETVDGFIAFDLDDCAVNAGGTRLAPDVTETEAALLARAMTYKFAVLGIPTGGAKGAVRAKPAEREEVMRRYCEEIRPLVETTRFLTGPDLGTFESDFGRLRREGELTLMREAMDGVPFEDVLTGYGVIAAAGRTLGSLDGRTVAVEGFGKVGGGVAREAVRRGARVTAVSTLAGCVEEPRGFDVEELWRLRAKHGDDLVRHLGHDVRPVTALFESDVDVLVPGARTGVIDLARANRLRARVVAPAANVPYVAGVPERLRERGILALADFVCNAGAVIGYLARAESGHREVLESAGQRIGDLVAASLEHPQGPFAGACSIAESFLRSWRDHGALPPGPPLA